MEKKLKILPIQIIEKEDKIVLKRGVTSIAIPDKSSLIIIKVIQKALLQSPKSIDELTALFSGSIRGLIEDFINHLINKKFIVFLENDELDDKVYDETPQDIFYWHFNKSQDEIAGILNEKQWAFIGINELNKRLIQALFSEGKNDCIVVDDPSLRNINFFDDNHKIIDDFWDDLRITKVDGEKFLENYKDIGFIVAASEFGSFNLLEPWNANAAKYAIPFYPLVLQNMVGYAGPLVIPDEGACLECLKLRQNSASEDFQEKRIAEEYAFEGQKTVAYHNGMLNILAETGAFDLIKFKSNIQWEIGTFCEINLLGGSMNRRKLLKAPRCSVCSPLKDTPLVNIHKQLTSNDAWDEIEQTVGYHE